MPPERDRAQRRAGGAPGSDAPARSPHLPRKTRKRGMDMRRFFGMPTWKWWTATITAAGTVAVLGFTGDGINTDPEIITVIGLIVQRLVAYATPNEATDAPEDTGK